MSSRELRSAPLTDSISAWNKIGCLLTQTTDADAVFSRIGTANCLDYAYTRETSIHHPSSILGGTKY